MVHTRTYADPDAAATVEGTDRSTALDLPVLFYRYQREAVSRSGTLLSETVLEGVMIPWQLMSALLAYVILVVRWDLTNRWAQHVLHGRRGARRLRKQQEEQREQDADGS